MSETTTTTPIYLDADDYDALELSALAFGGIGNGSMWRRGKSFPYPHCVHGHAVYMEYGEEPFQGLSLRLSTAGLYVTMNDRIVKPGTRISWATYVRRGNIIRRDASAPAARRAH